jgi:hypothetical protein
MLCIGVSSFEEFTEVLCRVKIAGNECDAYAYPYSGLVTELVDNIQQGLIFPKIKEEIIDTKPKVFLEVR